ncbi:hypothetical protein QCA50_014099 [Cerrena zonata]|uniref:GST N-terminal domain-containing protein n=1 Tax=Cerrena zonata TaxID=2478898 RepID=A0AAW0FPQ3_9APHY
MSAPIVLYDIPGRNPKYPAWSPSTWRTRYALAFKGLPFRTEWIEYPDIEPTCKKLGAKHTRTRLDGTPVYTVPVISDPNTETAVEDSLNIAKYLDMTYPDTPRLFPDNTFVLHSAFTEFLEPITRSFVPNTILAVCDNFSPISAEYFRRVQEQTFGVVLEDLVPSDEESKMNKWNEARDGFDKIAGWFEKSGNNGSFVMGDTITYADIDLVSRLIWVKIVMGEESEAWVRIAQWNGGRWQQHLKLMQKYENLS